jgi:hypothetical protein
MLVQQNKDSTMIDFSFSSHLYIIKLVFELVLGLDWRRRRLGVLKPMRDSKVGAVVRAVSLFI